MTGPLRFEPSESGELSPRARLMLAIVASLVLLVALGVVEVGVLAALSVFSHTHQAVTQ